jgi:hypothetical protein
LFVTPRLDLCEQTPLVTRVARFFLLQTFQFGKNIEMTINYTKRPFIIPNGRKIFQIVMKYTNIYHSKALQNLPKFGIWLENKPFGNPACDQGNALAAKLAFVFISPT